MSKAFIAGCAGISLSDGERAFFADERPWGLIVFARNVGSRDELLALTADFRRAVDDERAPVLIDQEGGRVQRLRAPLAPDYPSNLELGALYANDAEGGLRATYLLSRMHAFDLARVGIDIDCLPVLDVPVPGAHAVIGDRAYGFDPASVAALGRAACEGLLDGGVLPVIKHMPGHGRADADSHKELPVVTAPLDELEANDFAPFRELSDMPVGMSAHVRYTAIDPTRPGTTSPAVIGDVVRGHIGFDGLLLSDDVSMHALQGDFGARTRDLLGAGCDIALHCNGAMDEARAVAAASPELSGRSLDRAERALALREAVVAADEEAVREEFRRLTGRDVARPAA